MLAMLQIYLQVQQFSCNQNGWLIYIYGDPAYPLQGLFKGNKLTPLQKQYNTAEVEALVESVFRDIVNYFAFMDF